MKLLLDRGADINVKDKYGKTALHLAASCGYKAKAQLLLDRGADISATDNDSLTALQIAVKQGNQEVAEILRNYRGKGTGSSGGPSHR